MRIYNVSDVGGLTHNIHLAMYVLKPDVVFPLYSRTGLRTAPSVAHLGRVII